MQAPNTVNASVSFGPNAYVADFQVYQGDFSLYGYRLFNETISPMCISPSPERTGPKAKQRQKRVNATRRNQPKLVAEVRCHGGQRSFDSP